MRPLLLALLAVFAAAPAADLAAHPHVEVVERYRAASKAGDVESLTQLLSDDSRIWFGERAGQGEPRDPSGRGPWADWDEVFQSRVTTLEAHVEGESVRTVVSEINDWYLLVERPASRYQITYWLDGDDRIEGMLVHPVPGPRPARSDRLGDFQAWARRHHPGLLEWLSPSGEIDPTKALDWKHALQQWREESGLFDPLTGAAPETAIAPRPFTAQAIREAMPPGTRLRFRLEEPGAPPVISAWEVLATDAARMTMQSRLLSADGEPLGEPVVAETEWTAVRDHARFPAAVTRLRRATVEVPAGRFDSRLYEVSGTRDGVRTVTRLHFVPELPGPPVLRTVERNGEVVHRMELLSRE